MDVTDKALLTSLIDRAITYFLDASHPHTGLIADRAKFDGSSCGKIASVAACGFGLSAFAIAAETGRLSELNAIRHARRLLWSLANQVEHFQGILFHFVAANSGTRIGDCEASTIDTALAIAGALHASVVFSHDAHLCADAQKLFQRANWNSLIGSNGCLHMGWTPENGTLKAQWDQFSEHPILYLLAIAAPEHTLPTECWDAWQRQPVLHYDGTPFLSYPPLFVHQYPWAYFDVRGQRDRSGWDFWSNSQVAHRAHIDYLKSLSQSQPEKFSHYGDDCWGITSSDSQRGYRDWGGPYEDGMAVPRRGIDGTVVPSAAGGALAILPQEALRTLQFQKQTYGEAIFGPYGFVNAYHPGRGWYSSDVIGIDQGITMLMAHNLLCGGVWNAFMRHPLAQFGLSRAGFQQSHSVHQTQ
ncbi:hypothetical protein LOC67_23740 [Stieleria sp. JC731]|uniref:glucoamylase family protein n=1 Tax=Pirellulaceae TaxID=2691357 RepID=UPI001E42387B|nr:glucoamylase family protein [Stieleria sp. JC731]MCC9603573.1 hypothetical protein [Stieleria sp. JC731]